MNSSVGSTVIEKPLPQCSVITGAANVERWRWRGSWSSTDISASTSSHGWSQTASIIRFQGWLDLFHLLPGYSGARKHSHSL